MTYMLTSYHPTYLRAYQITTLPINLATSLAIVGDLTNYTNHQSSPTNMCTNRYIDV